MKDNVREVPVNYGLCDVSICRW